MRQKKMKKLWFICIGLVLLGSFGLSGIAQATTYTFNPVPADLYDLDHYKYYTWGMQLNLGEQETVLGASLYFNNIRNWDSEDNRLYLHLLDLGASDELGVEAYNDSDVGFVDKFSGQGTWLNTWLNTWSGLPNTPQNIKYDFDAAELADLVSYLSDGYFGLGFDPDCHFYNTGIQLVVQTPEPGTMLLLGFGLVGLTLVSGRRFLK